MYFLDIKIFFFHNQLTGNFKLVWYGLSSKENGFINKKYEKWYPKLLTPLIETVKRSFWTEHAGYHFVAIPQNVSRINQMASKFVFGVVL